MCVLGPSVCAGAAGDTEQRGSAAAERRSVAGDVCKGRRSTSSSKSVQLYFTLLHSFIEAGQGKFIYKAYFRNKAKCL